MSVEKDKLWSAYLDGELSTSEAAGFDESLTPRECQRLQSEMRLERGLAEVMQEATPCPDAVWAQVRARIQAQSVARPVATRWSPRWLAVAAGILFLVGVSLAYGRFDATPAFLNVPSSVSELVAHSEWRESWDNAQTYLHDHNIQLALRPLEPEKLDVHRRLEFLGASHATYHGADVVELFFECCNRPIMLSVAAKDSDAALKMVASAGVGDVKESRVIGDYVVAYVGHHPAYGLMSVFEEI